VRKVLLAALAVALVGRAAALCPAQTAAGTAKPVLTVSVAGYNAIGAQADKIGKLIGQADVVKMFEANVPPPVLKAIDKSKPWGLVVMSTGAEKTPMELAQGIFAFLPVTDVPAILALLPGPDGKPAAPGPDGVYTVPLPNGPPVSILPKGGWAFVAPYPNVLKSVPADPTTLLGGLPKKYLVAVQASVKNVPAGFRKQFVAQLQQQASAEMKQNPGETLDQFAIRTGVAKQMIDQVVTAANDLDEMLLGLGADAGTGATYFDLEITAQSGTKTAQQFARLKDAKSSFSGLVVPGAAMTALVTQTLDDNDVKQAKTSFGVVRTQVANNLEQSGLPKEQIQLAKQVVEDLFQVLEKTIEKKQLDCGAVLLLDPGALTAVAGATVAEGAKLEKAVKQVVTEASKEQPMIADMVKLDVEKHQGVNFHTVTIPMNDPEGAKVFGKSVVIVAGIGPDTAYVGVGSNAIKTIKQAIDKSKTPVSVPPAQIVVTLGPIVKFAEAVAPGPPQQMAAAIGKVLAQSPGKDHISITVKAIPNGESMRLSVEEGVIKAGAAGVGQMMPMMGGGMPPGGPGGPVPPPAKLNPLN
jgi:hypothetical protein